MRKLFIVLLLFFCVMFAFAHAQADRDVELTPQRPSRNSDRSKIYDLPEDAVPESESHLVNNILAGTESGLYKIVGSDTPVPLWTEGRVTQIVETQVDDTQIWYFVTGEGLLRSTDLKNFTFLGEEQGLPVLTIKTYDGTEKQLVRRAKEIKDLAVHPQNPQILVATTDSSVYITKDGGDSWKSLGFSSGTSGAKAVAVADMPIPGAQNEDGSFKTELTVFLSHSINGLSYTYPDRSSPKWIDLTGGFSALPTQGDPDEISDILPVVTKTPEGHTYTEVYASQTFMPNVYKIDWNAKRAVKIYAGPEPLDTIDSLASIGDSLLYTSPGKISVLKLETGENLGIPADYSSWQKAISKVPEPVYAAYIPKTKSGFETSVTLRELWLLKPEKIYTPYSTDTLRDVKAIYLPANQGRTESGQNNALKVIKDNKLNAVVIDMKDDYGLLRYDTKDPLVLEKGYISQYAVDLDQFVKKFKDENIYLIARIVVFKDKNLSQYGGGKYAVWNRVTGGPWVGTRGTEDVVDEEGNVTGTQTVYYDENWVDPYSEEVWEYNIAIAKELISRGFDEIQFDYIRFPTDGLNLSQASYRWQDPGMNKESALRSFLSYARENIDAPIGIDIYGANGWYRSGARTGQDVELLSDFVDVICPMFYPSHFEQDFLAQAPKAERPYRIYFNGTYRNSIIARNKCVVRPWAQAFYLPVSYDKVYYNNDYVQRQIFGTRDGANNGYMYWNNTGRYDDLRPDVDETTPYPWENADASMEFRKPALTGEISKGK